MVRVRHHGYRDDGADRARIRALLIAIHPLAPTAWAWDVRRWDGWCFHREDPRIDGPRAAGIHLWETPDGSLVGAVHPDGDGEAVLAVHPAFRDLEPTMLDWAEAHVARPNDDAGWPALEIVVQDDDEPRLDLVRSRGYVRLAGPWHARRRPMAAGVLPEAAAPLADDYRLATTSPATLDVDAARMGTFLNAAFGRTIHSAAEYRTFMTASPSFRHDLNLVALAPDASFAAHVGCTLDDQNRYGIVEPVATHPAHRRRGLARSLLLEGVRRLGAAGATAIGVETGDDPAANALYEACGFTEVTLAHAWRRTW